MINTIKHICHTAFRQLRRITVVIGVLAVTAVVWSLIATHTTVKNAGVLPGADSSLAVSEVGWGSETLDAADSWSSWSLIQSANACGLGASSCFKCHNGKRAKKWSEDLITAPWHPNHKKVNFSCAGCHKGNPRLLKKSLAHRKLIADPRTTPSESCVKCHKGQDTAKLLKPYAIREAK